MSAALLEELAQAVAQDPLGQATAELALRTAKSVIPEQGFTKVEVEQIREDYEGAQEHPCSRLIEMLGIVVKTHGYMDLDRNRWAPLLVFMAPTVRAVYGLGDERA